MTWFRKHVLLRRLRNLSLQSVTLIMLVGVVICNEFLVNWIQSYRWPSMPETRDPNQELVILFAADPQLIGIQDEHGFPVGPISRWDSDRFLRKTFSLAHSYVQPDVVVFLGDLMDEGSKATRSEYESYLSRFQSIFYSGLQQSKVVYISGDNDIGGEGADFRTKFKMSRFERHFENLTGVVNYGFIDFIKLDIRSQYDSFTEKKRAMADLTHRLTAPIRIIINHEPVISQQKMLVYPLLKLAQPNLIFSGHWHESLHYVCETCLSSNENSDHWPVHLRDLRKLKGWTEVDFTNLISVNEFMVPTCSYRMGTKTMGYGVAVIKRSGSMQYTVLWLPHRYTQLYAYLVALGVIFFVVLMLYIFIYVNKSHRR